MKAVVVLSCLVVALAGCGGGDHRPNPAPAGNAIGDGHRGGRVTFLASGTVGSLDPALARGALGAAVAYATGRPLYAYAPDHPARPVADLADGPPEVSANDRTITVHLKPGVRYSTGGTVRAQDVAYAIERAFTTSVPSPDAFAFFGEVEGAPSALVAIGRLRPFAGLQTPDDLTLVIKLTRPVAQRTVAALATPLTVPVPQGYARRMDARVPSTYGKAVAATGPYVAARGPDRVTLTRNAAWTGTDDFRPAFLDAITITEHEAGAARRALSGQHLLCCDVAAPSVAALAAGHPQQLGTVSAGGTRWVTLNHSRPPFDDVNVRRAVTAGVDRDALRAAAGGPAAGPVAQGFLPPGMPGFVDSDADDLENPQGDPAVFKRYMLASGAPADPATGRYTGAGAVTVGGEDPVSRAMAGQLRRLGFHTALRAHCDAAADVCLGSRFKQLVDPQPLLAGFAGLDPAIDRAMDAAALLAGNERSDAWGALNRRLIDAAPAVPYLWDVDYGVQSADMRAVMNGSLGTWDLSFSSVR